ncbi:GDP-mannose 4,6-dehydratase [bacterium]|nr:GDP-mannose 4,6-dehydratase [bacterium]
MKKALITGITGQDGSYLAEFLLEQGYEVYGMVRRNSTENFERIEHIRDSIHLVQGDLLDQMSLIKLIREIHPDEVYNLAAQSFVPTSWDQPVFTGEATGLGVTRMLEAIRYEKPDTKFYQASSSEMFGKVREMPQNENTPFYPRSPYGVAKVYGHFITVNYRESYGIFAVSGILFNHESPRRGKEFVTRKITDAVARIKFGLQDVLELGNLDAKRDWGYAGDYVRMMWMMLQQPEPDDYVIGTGQAHSVREFATIAFRTAGYEIIWEGEGLNERGIDAETGKTLVVVSRRYFRPAEVHHLLADPTKAREKLGWEPQVSFEQLVEMMVRADIMRYEKLLGKK